MMADGLVAILAKGDGRAAAAFFWRLQEQLVVQGRLGGLGFQQAHLGDTDHGLFDSGEIHRIAVALRYLPVITRHAADGKGQLWRVHIDAGDVVDLIDQVREQAGGRRAGSGGAAPLHG